MQTIGTDRAARGERGTLAAVSLTGIAYFVLAWVPQTDGPDRSTATADQIRRFVEGHRTGLEVHATIDALAIPLVVVMTVCLARLLRAGAPHSPLPDVVAAGGVLLAMWHWVVMAATSSMLIQLRDGTDLATVDDATVRGWYGLGNFAELFADVGVVAMVTVMGAASLSALHHGPLPRWIAWAGMAFSVGGLIGVAGVTMTSKPVSNAWFVGAFGWFLWVMGVAVACGLRAGARATPDAHGPSAVPAGQVEAPSGP